MITDRDRQIYNHVERFGFATYEQIAKIFFNEQKYGYDVARKRLNKLIGQQYFKKFRNLQTNQTIITIPEDTIKKVSEHNIIIMNYYAELISNGANVTMFDREYDREKLLFDGKIRPDALIEFFFNGFRYCQALEVQTSNNKVNLEKYEDLAIKEKMLKIYNNVLPNLVLVADTIKSYKADGYIVIQLETNLGGFPKVFM